MRRLQLVRSVSCHHIFDVRYPATPKKIETRTEELTRRAKTGWAQIGKKMACAGECLFPFRVSLIPITHIRILINPAFLLSFSFVSFVSSRNEYPPLSLTSSFQYPGPHPLSRRFSELFFALSACPSFSVSSLSSRNPARFPFFLFFLLPLPYPSSFPSDLCR